MDSEDILALKMMIDIAYAYGAKKDPKYIQGCLDALDLTDIRDRFDEVYEYLLYKEDSHE